MTRLFRLSARRALCAGLVLGLLAYTAPAGAAPATWSLSRASFGIDAKAAVLESPERSSAFLPGAYLSWSATSQLSLAATIERDFSEHLTIGQLGARFLVARMSEGQLAAGVNLVGYGDEGAEGFLKPTSWNASLHGSYPVWQRNGATVAWGIASASYDSDNSLGIYRLGLRYQGIGGRDVQ